MKFETKRKLLHIVYPTKCPSCNGYIGANDRFCAGCYSKFIRYSGNFQIPGATSFSSVFLYDDNIHPAITTLKNGVCGNAPYALGSELSELLISNSTARKVDVIIPVPMTRAERKRRGYNQSLLLAKTVSRIIGKLHALRKAFQWLNAGKISSAHLQLLTLRVYAENECCLWMISVRPEALWGN